MTVSVVPTQFEFVDFDAAVIAGVVQQLAQSIGITEPITVEIDETTPLSRVQLHLDGGLRLAVESGALEDARKPRQFSETAAALAIHNAQLAQALVEQELNTAGHVILLADVCRAATIAGQKTTALGGAVADIGEAPGELLGLMAARPKELSNESPEFGGGHGAFTYSLMRGLDGAADADKDGVVTSGEIIDFVTKDVSKLTSNRQHPRDFGTMDSGLKLSDLSRPGIKVP